MNQRATSCSNDSRLYSYSFVWRTNCRAKIVDDIFASLYVMEWKKYTWHNRLGIRFDIQIIFRLRKIKSRATTSWNLIHFYVK